MELSFKYQYTYFLHPYIIEEDKFEKYILKLIKDKRASLRIFEKEKDLDIYNYFSPVIRDNLFPTFELRGEKLKNFKQLKPEKQAKILAAHSCVCFEYMLGEKIEGEYNKESGIVLFSIRSCLIHARMRGVGGNYGRDRQIKRNSQNTAW